MAARTWLLASFAVFALACGNNPGSDGDAGTGDGDGGNGNGEPDAFELVIDAPPFVGTCTPVAGAPECSDCIDNDGDNRIDGFDPECTGPLDRREDSFATGIPGDNIDATFQDCFFDGDSGGGNDGCNQHVCCLLQADSIMECGMLAPEANANKYDKNKCYQPWGNTPVPSKCTMNCGPLSPPGCDCFGCCTVCNENGCRDIVLNPAVSPTCDQTNITSNGTDGIEGTADDPCQRCVKLTACGSTECAYDGVSCTPCPGQCDMNGVCNPPLPSSCTAGPTCPDGYTPGDAANNNACPIGSYCTNGCCVGDVIL